MIFSYGTTKEPSTVKITAIFKNEAENDFTFVTKTISLKGEK